jgi:hypothetical protein
MIRVLAVVGGMAGAVALSQFPEFSQQYLQRLAGQVDALRLVVVGFDASAAANGLGRDAALAQMTGTAFLEDQRDQVAQTLARYDRLSANLAALRGATPLARLTMPQRLADPQTLAATWDDFRPAMPVTMDGALCAVAGYLGGWLGTGGILGLLAMPFRRRVDAGRR